MFIKQSFGKAAKKYKCECCNKNIEVGDPYYRITFRECGQIKDQKLCTFCKSIIDNYTYNNGVSEYDYDDVIDYIQNKNCSKCAKSKSCEKDIFDCKKLKDLYDIKDSQG